MKERQILFSGAMVRALLDGSKTQTRRVAPITDLNINQYNDDMVTWSIRFSKPVKGVLGSYSGGKFSEAQARSILASMYCQYGQPGDRLVVRETWQYANWTEDGYPWIAYQADGAQRLCDSIPTEEWSSRLMDIWAGLSSEENFTIDNRAADRRWRPSIHMPRWASRITLEVTGVRVERLQDISEVDAIAEGIEKMSSGFWNLYGQADADGTYSPRASYRALWESIVGPGSWDANPWVWVIEFRRITS